MGTTIGLPRETKIGERRVALTPSAVASAVAAGHELRVEASAGAGAGFSDADYSRAGAVVVASARDAWSCDVVVKVKEPQPGEYRYFRPGLTLFAYLHLAAEPALSQALVGAGVTAFAFETLTAGGRLPLLAPMSEIAGRAAAIVAAQQLSAVAGGSGTLVGGAAGVAPARAVVIGLGVAGTMAARGLRGLDAEVIGVDLNLDRLNQARFEGAINFGLVSERSVVAEVIAGADIVIGAALVPGARAPIVVDGDAVAEMRPGSVIVDLAIDQGGCIATARPTTHSDPTYLEHGVVHYCVTNVPGQYPRTASAALSAAVTPSLLLLATNPDDPRLAGSLNVAGGALIHPALVAA